MGKGLSFMPDKFETGKTIDATHNLVFSGMSAQTAVVHITATTSLSVIAEGTMDDVMKLGESNCDWFPLFAQIVNTTAITDEAAGATITPADDDRLLVELGGAKFGRLRRSAGSGTASYSLSGQGSIEALLKAILDDTSVSAVGGIVVTKSFAFTKASGTTAYSAKDVVAPAQLTVTDATNASPIVVTCGTHGLSDGDPVTIASVGGNTNANGNYFAKVTGYSTTTFAVYTDAALTTPKAGNSAYTSGGTVDRLLVWQDLGRLASGSGILIKASLLTDQTTCTESFRLHLFNGTQTAIADNGVCTAPLYAQAANYIGTIDFQACATEGTGVTAAYSNMTTNTSNSKLPLAFTVGTSPDIYGILETPNGFTPASAQGVTIKLTAIQN